MLRSPLIDQESGQSAEQNHEDGVDLEQTGTHERETEDDNAAPKDVRRVGDTAEVLTGHQQQGRSGNQTHDSGTQSRENVVDPTSVLVLDHIPADGEHQQERQPQD